MNEQRRLAAILVADVVGFSRLVGADESGTLARLATLRRDIVDPSVARHAGRLFKQTGDGFLVEFASAVAAVSCAIEIQKAAGADSSLPLRIGIHVGDVVVEGDDLMGDGVNIAARIEGVAEPGGIAVSRAVHEQVRDRLDASFVDKGEIALKNIGRPVHVFAVGGAAAPTAPALALPDKPSIAVLPFQNMSGDPEQEYFADGMVEDIITALSRFKSLFVISRNSSFTYKGKAVEVRQVGRELGVRYVLEGSVRKAGDKVRITGQLIDAASGAHLWADRFDGSIEDIFDLQDRVTAEVVSVLDVSIATAEMRRTARKPTHDLSAYDYFLRGAAAFRVYTRESVEAAASLFAKALEIDPGFTRAYAMIAWCHIARKARAWPRDDAAAAADARQLAQRVWDIEQDDAFAIGITGHALALVAGDLDTGHGRLERALSLNPNIAVLCGFAAIVSNWLGRHELAIEYATRGLRLSPRDPGISVMRGAIAHACFFAGQADQAAAWALAELREFPNNTIALRIGAASLAMAGDLPGAQALCSRMRDADPQRRVSNLGDVLGPYRQTEPLRLYQEGLRLAGLPE